MKVIKPSIEEVIDPFFALSSGLISTNNYQALYELFTNLYLSPDDWLKSDEQMAAYRFAPGSDTKGMVLKFLRALFLKALPRAALQNAGKVNVAIENIGLFTFYFEDGVVCVEEAFQFLQQSEELFLAMSKETLSAIYAHISISSAKWDLQNRAQPIYLDGVA